MSRLPGMGMRDNPITISEDEGSEDEIQILINTSQFRKRKRDNSSPILLDISDDDKKLQIPVIHKRARITTPNSAAGQQQSYSQTVITIEDSDSNENDSDSDYSCLDGTYRENDLNLNVEEWPIPRVQMLTTKLRKKEERIIDTHLRKLGRFSEEDRFLQLREVTGALGSLRHCFPLVHTHKLTARWNQRQTLGLFSTEASVHYPPNQWKSLPELRLGGCPNTITQSSGVAVIAANVHGADSDEISPANHNGLAAISCLDGVQLPFSTAGHARRLSTNASDNGQKEVASSTFSDRGVIYETVFDVQFDPADPKRFITVGNDDRGIIWTIQEAQGGGLIVNSPCNGSEGMKEYEKPMGSRPHFIRFSPNPRHWSYTDEVSAYIITDGKARFHVEFPTHQSFVVPIDKQKREIASILWGQGRSSDMIFAGTESDGFPDTRGRQAAFLIHPTRAPVPQPYTDSQDEVEALALNPGGDLLASFTRTCQATAPVCKKCGRRRVYSKHKLSLYPVTGSGAMDTRKSKIAALVEVNLPKFDAFNGSDTANDAGLVVSAAWSICGKYLAAARDDDFIDVFDSRYLGRQPLMRLAHQTPPRVEKYRQAYSLEGDVLDCCAVLEKHPKHGITGLQWVQGTGYFGGEGLMSAGSDGCVRLWDIRQAGVYETLVQLETSAACISVGDITRKEISLIAADNDGLIEMRTIVT